MTEPSAARDGMTVSRIIRASREAVYRACLDPGALVRWRVPDTMTGRLDFFEAREGGSYRMCLTYQDRGHSPGGKTSEDTDVFVGRFIELIACERIVELVEFESSDARFSGEMKITTRLAEVAAGTEVAMIFEGLPAGIRAEDNESGTRQSLRKLAALLE